MSSIQALIKNMSLFAAYSVVIIMFFHLVISSFITMVMLKCKKASMSSIQVKVLIKKYVMFACAYFVVIVVFFRLFHFINNGLNRDSDTVRVFNNFAAISNTPISESNLL